MSDTTVSPVELRSFRESLGLSRREFAPRLFVSEPTLERWERGQGGPRDVHLHILRRMRELRGFRSPGAYYQYDAVEDAANVVLPQEEKRLIVKTLMDMAAVLQEQRETKDRKDWFLRFGLGWGEESVDVAISCGGSEQPMRPAVDFTLEVTTNWGDQDGLGDALPEICYDHGVSWKLPRKSRSRSTLGLRLRSFKPGCTEEKVRHVIGNFQSCWRRIKKSLHGTKP